jgi:hypothetical protein
MLSFTIPPPVVLASDGVPLVIGADLFQVDQARKLLYIVVGTGSGWVLASYNLPAGDRIQSATVGNEVSPAVDFQLSSDGAYLYVTDTGLNVMRFRTDTLVKDLQFQIAADAPPLSSSNTVETRHKLRPLDDTPEGLLVVTPAGRMIVYDRDQQRPYTTTDFPAPGFTAMDPVLVHSTYVYALQRADVYHLVPCVVRYPLDAFGFGPPEEFCSIGTDWAQYPEMKTYAGILVLQNDAEAWAISQTPNSFGNMRLPYSCNPSQNLFAISNSLGTYASNILFTRMDTGDSVGVFPAQAALNGLAASTLLLDDGTLVFFEQVIPRGSRVAIVPQWQTLAQLYQ